MDSPVKPANDDLFGISFVVCSNPGWMDDVAFPDFTSFHPGYGMVEPPRGGNIGRLSPTSPAAKPVANQGRGSGSLDAIPSVAR